MTPHVLTSLRRLQKPTLCMSILCASLGAALNVAPLAANAQTSGTVRAQLILITPQIRAYAQVQPISLLPLNAAETGVLSGLSVVPGMQVHAGEKLASLQGPGIRSQILQDEANARSARVQLSAAEKTLAVQRQQIRTHLSTRETLHQAESAAAQAQAKLDNAQSRLDAVRQLAAIIAPVDSVVAALNSANGELVSAGQTVVTLQPSQALWLRGSYYGGNLNQIRTGMSGVFRPSDGGAPIPIRVRAMAGVINPGGGESILMTPRHSPVRWINGESGTVSLHLPPVKAVVVPTRALILNQGRWWVMVRTSRGDHPQAVVPGPVQGWNTSIMQGLAPGAEVIVKNAYLLFHAKIAEHFQIPD
jgi:RND family efflux transporter MFP subunit